jgi:glycosyltransferase involved in cell wall biosynthesis
MKITIIANGFQEDYMYNLVNNLALLRCQVEFIGSTLYQSEKLHRSVVLHNLRGDHDAGVPVFRKVWRNLQYYGKMMGHVLRNKPDLIHIQWLNLTLIDGILFPLFFRMMGIKVCYTAHDVLPHSRGHALNRLLFALIYRCQHIVFVHTNFIRDRLVKEFHLNPTRIFVIRHGVYEVVDNKGMDRKLARQRLSLAEGGLVWLFFGIITRYKGLPILFKAFSSIAAHIPRSELVIAGKVSEEYQAEFNQLVKAYPSDRIHIFQGFVDSEMLEMLYKAADVTILPYLEASQSGVLFMSYAYGKPVIVPELGGFPDDILEGTTGYLFRPGDAVSLADTLIRFNKEWSGKDVQANERIRKFASENYSWAGTAEALVKVYTRLVGASGIIQP